MSHKKIQNLIFDLGKCLGYKSYKEFGLSNIRIDNVWEDKNTYIIFEIETLPNRQEIQEKYNLINEFLSKEKKFCLISLTEYKLPKELKKLGIILVHFLLEKKKKSVQDYKRIFNLLYKQPKIFKRKGFVECLSKELKITTRQAHRYVNMLIADKKLEIINRTTLKKRHLRRSGHLSKKLKTKEF